MTPEQWERLNALFEAAVERKPEERSAFLDEACQGDEELRREVVSLLSERERARSFLEEPPASALSEGGLPLSGSLGAPPSGSADDAEEYIGLAVKGRYHIETKLGRGGFGSVYLARDEQLLSKPVVIKILRRSRTVGWSRKKFRQEIAALARLDHPGIVTISDTGEMPDGRPFFVMQYVKGTTLRHEIELGPMPFDRVAVIVRQVGQSLEAAHDKGICHLDLKPENIMVQQLGGGEIAVKLIDFGIARVTGPEATTQSGQTRPAGTINYMAPEQLFGRASALSDIYAFGVIAHEMLTGSRPHPSGRAKPRDLCPSLTAEADRVILRALEFDPGNRYSRAREFSEALVRALLAEPATGVDRHRGVKWRWVAAIRAAFGILLLALLTISFPRGEPGPPAAVDSVVVVASLESGSDRGAAYLADGITEGIVSSLSRIPSLRVVTRGSVDRTPEPDDLALGKALGVRAVLRSKYRTQGELLQVSVDLADSKSGNLIWGEAYGRQTSEALALQELISQDLTARLGSHLNRKDQERLTRLPTKSAEAYVYYAKGRYLWNKRTVEDFRKAIDFFQWAIIKDPDFALAFTGLADSYALLGSAGYDTAPPREIMPKAKDAARRALEIDDTLAEAHTSMGIVHLLYDWDWTLAERELTRAIQLNSNYLTAQYWYAIYLMAMGRHEEAIKWCEQSVAIDPVSPVLAVNVARAFYLARRFDTAIRQSRQILDLNPDFMLAVQFVGMSYLQLRNYDTSISYFRRMLEIAKSSDVAVASIATAQAMAGRKGEARRIFAELENAQGYASESNLAIICAGLGENDQALKHLDRAYESRSSALVFLKVEPLFDGLRGDPRFTDLLHRMNFP